MLLLARMLKPLSVCLGRQMAADVILGIPAVRSGARRTVAQEGTSQESEEIGVRVWLTYDLDRRSG